jgi:filamentous hemagglutinin
MADDVKRRRRVAAHPRVLLPRIRGTQVGLRDWSVVDRIKADMRVGQYAFHERRGQIGGVRDWRGTYYVIEGHHRVVAALKWFYDSGDASAVLELLRWGQWTGLDKSPSDRRPLPARHWWGAFRNWIGY